MSRHIGQLAAALLAALALGLLAGGHWLAPSPAVASTLARQDRPTIPPPRPTVAPEPEPTEEPEAGEEENEEETGGDEEAQPVEQEPTAATEEPTQEPTEEATPEPEEVVEAEPEALPTTLPATGGAEAAGPLLAGLGLAALVVGMRLRRRG